MSKKTFISVKRGLISDPKHRARMGNRIWTYLHIIDRADYETGTVYDWKDKDESDDAGLNWRTMQRQRQELEELGYIRCELTGRGMNIVIFNWHNPRSYSGKAINPRSNNQPETEETDPAEDESEYANLRTQSTHESTHESTQTVIKDLRTPTYNSQITNHMSYIARKRAPADPRTSSPQIRAFREVTRKLPHISTYESVIQKIGSSAIDDLRPLFSEWCSRGYNPNGQGWLDWIATGIPVKFSARHSGNASGAEALAELERWTNDTRGI